MMMMETMKWTVNGTNTGDTAMSSESILVALTIYLDVAKTSSTHDPPSTTPYLTIPSAAEHSQWSIP